MNKHRRMAVLHGRNPNCFWCGEPTRVLPVNEKIETRKSWPLDMAVLCHLDSKFDLDRGTHRGGSERTILSCLSCDRERSRQISLANAEEQKRRSHA